MSPLSVLVKQNENRFLNQRVEFVKSSYSISQNPYILSESNCHGVTAYLLGFVSLPHWLSDNRLIDFLRENKFYVPDRAESRKPKQGDVLVISSDASYEEVMGHTGIVLFEKGRPYVLSKLGHCPADMQSIRKITQHYEKLFGYDRSFLLRKN